MIDMPTLVAAINQLDGQGFFERWTPAAKPDEQRQAFLDAAAMQVMATISATNKTESCADDALWSYTAAEALWAEREQRRAPQDHDPAPCEGYHHDGTIHSLPCALATIARLREQIARLEAERKERT